MADDFSCIVPPMDYRDLEVWQRTMDLAELVYRRTAGMPPEEKFCLTRQIRESAASISANVAEGSGRYGSGELVYFIGVANGSRTELESRMILANRLGYVSDITEILELSSRVGMMLTKLKQAIKRKIAK